MQAGEWTDVIAWHVEIISEVIKASRTWLKPAAAAWDFRSIDEHHSREWADGIFWDELKR